MWAAETGVLGFLLYYALLLVMMKKLWKLTVSPDPWIYLASLGFFAVMLGSLSYRFTSPYFFQEVYSQFCVILAVTCLLEKLEKKRLAGARVGSQNGGSSQPSSPIAKEAYATCLMRIYVQTSNISRSCTRSFPCYSAERESSARNLSGFPPPWE
jgi:O-antigen ligase